MEDTVIMFNSTDEEIIDSILPFIMKRANRRVSLRELVMIPKEKKSLIHDKLFSRELIEKVDQQNTGYGDTITISKNALQIITEHGTYINYLKYNQSLAEKTSEKEALSEGKIMIEIEALKSQITLNNETINKNKYDKIIAILSFIISVAALVVAVLKK